MLRVFLVSVVGLFAVPLGAHAQSQPVESAKEAATSQPATVDLFARDTYRIDRVVCPFKGTIDYKPGEIECGLLQVPENRENARSRFIELLFVKLAARSPDKAKGKQMPAAKGLKAGKRMDPIVYLTGGPGAKVGMYVKRLKEHTILDHRELYILEQRGIGFSGDFCPFIAKRKPEAKDVATFEAWLEGELTRTKDCALNAKKAGVDLRGYSTIENARDFKALRKALRIERWNVWGISYGSVLGQAYLKEDPRGIRAAVLDANLPLNGEGPFTWRVIKSYDRNLKLFDALCKGQSACAERYPKLGERIRQAIKSVGGKPISVEVEDSELFPSKKGRVFPHVVGMLPFAAMYEQKGYVALPGLIHAWTRAIERRNAPLLRMLALAGDRMIKTSEGMSNAIMCLDGRAETFASGYEADTKQFPLLSSAVGNVQIMKRQAALCKEAGMAPRDRADYDPVKTDIPTLIIEGAMDPITPPPNAKQILPGFTKGTYVEFPYAGHGPSRSVKCAGAMLNKFFDAPADKPDISCVKEMKKPEFWTPLYETSVVPRLAVRALKDKRKLAGPAAWLGLSALILICAFFVLTFAPIGRLIDKRSAAPSHFARLVAWLTAVSATASLVLFGSAIAATFKASKMVLLVGLAPWARYGAILGLVAGVLGLATIALAIRAQLKSRLPIGTLLGFTFTGLAAVALMAFYLLWDLRPF